jgi:DNA-binding response OmpR family regulator
MNSDFPAARLPSGAKSSCVISDSQGPLETVLQETRHRFSTTFVARCDSFRLLVDDAAKGRETARRALIEAAHKLSGLAGTIGFPTVSGCAAELEQLVDAGPRETLDITRAHTIVAAIEQAYTRDLNHRESIAPPTPTRMPTAAVGQTILIAEDEADQREIVAACLSQAGYRPVLAVSGDVVIATARLERPALIVLDIAMPGLDGYAVCRQLKAAPDLAAIPVMFLTAGANLGDKLAGLSLGADEFLSKPVDLRELVLRVEVLLRRCRPPARGLEAPSVPAPPVAARVRTVVIAEDDPDVSRIVEAQLRAGGYAPVMAADGEQALAAVRGGAADVLVLDLMMPKLNGFDVLAAVNRLAGARPRIIVLSGRGREADVLRAFDLGADDYMTKPFNPHELIARIARLLA